jgi:hypothetical protein
MADVNPIIYFVTVFDDVWLEHKRVWNGAEPKKPYIDEKGRIVRERDDGMILYYEHDLMDWTGWPTKADPLATSESLQAELKIISRMSKDRYYGHASSRTWGYYFDLQKAIVAVENNYSDIHELKYTLALIEPMDSGIMSLADEESDQTLWYG